MTTPSAQRWNAVHEAQREIRLHDPNVPVPHADMVLILQRVYDAGSEDMAQTCLRIIGEYVPDNPDEFRSLRGKR